MEGTCIKCGIPFAFDEALVTGEVAVVICPSCRTKMVVRRDTTGPVDRFTIHKYEPALYRQRRNCDSCGRVYLVGAEGDERLCDRCVGKPLRRAAGRAGGARLWLPVIVVGALVIAAVLFVFGRSGLLPGLSLGGTVEPGRLEEIRKRTAAYSEDKQRRRQLEEHLGLARQGLALDTDRGYRIAFKDLKAALDVDPSSPEAIALYVSTYLRIPENQRGIEELKELFDLIARGMKQHPQSVRLIRAKALLMGYLGQTENSLEELAAALPPGPPGIDDRMTKAEILIRSSNPRAAIDDLETMITAGGYPLSALTLLARAYSLTGQLFKAVKTIERRNAEGDVSSEALTLLAEIQVRCGSLSDAASTYRRIIGLREDNINAQIRLAALTYQHFSETDEPLRMLLDLRGQSFDLMADSQKVQLLNHLSTIYRLRGEHELAWGLTVQARRISPGDPHAAFNLICGLILLDKASEVGPRGVRDAFEIIEYGLEQKWLVRTMQGLYELSRGNQKIASEHFGRAMEEGGRSVRLPHLFLAVQHLRGRNYDQAWRLLKETAATLPPYPEFTPPGLSPAPVVGRTFDRLVTDALASVTARELDLGRYHFIIGMSRYLTGDLEAARTSLLKVAGNDPRDLDASVLLADIAIRQRQHAEAERFLRRAERSGSLDLRMLFLSGINAERQRRYDQALDFFRRSIVAHPDFEPGHAGAADILLKQGKGEAARSAALAALQAGGRLPLSNRLRLLLDL